MQAILSDQRERIDLVVDDFLIEGVPVRNVSAVRKTDHQDRQACLAEKHVFDVLFIRLNVAAFTHFAAALPELVPVDEEVAVFGCFTVFDDVLELVGQNGDVVEDEVHHQVDLEIMKIVDIFGIGQGFGDLVVDQGEAAVKVGVEDTRQNVEGFEGVFKFFPF